MYGGGSSVWLSESRERGCMISPTSGRVTRNQQDYYSTFHRTANRKKFSKKDWHPLQSSLIGLLSILTRYNSFQMIIQITHLEVAHSTDENLVESGNRFSLFKW
ncbi:hypothetical protein CsSME_00046264 [Camellia sinensis var. sinensis]